MNDTSPQRIRGILKHPDVRRFAVSFGTVFSLGGLVLFFFLKTSNTGAVDPGSVVRPVDGKVASATAQTDEEPVSMSVKNEQDRRRETANRGDYRLVGGAWVDQSGQSTQSSGSARASSFAVNDRPSAAQTVYTVNTNGGPASFSNGGAFAVENPTAASEQQPSTAPTSQATGPQINDFPGTNEPPAGKPMLGKLPRGYTLEEMWYRTWYGWGAYNAAQQQGPH